MESVIGGVFGRGWMVERGGHKVKGRNRSDGTELDADVILGAQATRRHGHIRVELQTGQHVQYLPTCRRLGAHLARSWQETATWRFCTRAGERQ